MSEPDFLSQNGECLTMAERQDWFGERCRDGKSKGAIHHRFTVHPTLPNLILYEGWCERPYNDAGQIDEGEPRWQMSAVG